ncbi:TPA: hypothetical protein EYN98_13815 [Candidatus Poribacteria bacterium]|nr:hypothetical protein [Candidatus Poribacteria bacterium]HIN76568.1 hypothetical protein [Rhodospirillales bacterium]
MSECNTANLISSECAQVDIGFDYQLNYTYTDSSDAPIDLTGASFTMQIDEVDGTPVLTINTELSATITGFFITDATGGKFDLLITQTDTALIAAGGYVYTISFTSSGGLKSLFMKGSIEFADA